MNGQKERANNGNNRRETLPEQRKLVPGAVDRHRNTILPFEKMVDHLPLLYRCRLTVAPLPSSLPFRFPAGNSRGQKSVCTATPRGHSGGSGPAPFDEAPVGNNCPSLFDRSPTALYHPNSCPPSHCWFTEQCPSHAVTAQDPSTRFNPKCTVFAQEHVRVQFQILRMLPVQPLLFFCVGELLPVNWAETVSRRAHAEPPLPQS
eukprot:gene17042-biopygen8301